MMEVKLETPIMIPAAGGKDIETTKLQFPDRITAGHIRCFPTAFINGGTETKPEEFVPFIAGLLELPEHVIAQIDFADCAAIMGSLPGFLLKWGASISPDKEKK